MLKKPRRYVPYFTLTCDPCAQIKLTLILYCVVCVVVVGYVVVVCVWFVVV